MPDDDMREWLEHTVQRILALRPGRLLEVGCGSGLLLFRIAAPTADTTPPSTSRKPS